MKYLLLSLAFAGLLSCGESHEGHDHKHDHSHTQKNGTTPKIHDYKTHDPVCGMEREAGWEHYSVFNSDTVYFCAEHCKKGFDINPEKYTSLQ